MRTRRELSDRFWEKVNKAGPTAPGMLSCCWLFTGTVNKNGYGKIAVGGRYGGMKYAHVYAWEENNGPVPKGKMVLHGGCDNKLCVRHIYLGDHARNMADRQERGRTASGSRSGVHTKPQAFPKGSRRPSSKLTEEMIPALREMYNSNKSYTATAKAFGVDPATVRFVIIGRTWRHV